MEENTFYVHKTLKNIKNVLTYQDCADFAATTPMGAFWSWNPTRPTGGNCFIKWATEQKAVSGGTVSGSVECGALH